MQEDLTVYADLGTLPVRRLTSAISAIGAALEKLKDQLRQNSLTDQRQEIDFFKNDKPMFVAEQVYAIEIYTIETGKPLVDDQLIRTYYEGELRYIKRFFMQHQFLYQYYQLGATELDHLFFVRGARPTDIILPDAPGLDPNFSTAADSLFARFMAFEKVQNYLMDCLYGQGSVAQPYRSKKGRPLEWTGDKSNLVELAYAIYDTMQINNGEVDISDIIDWLENTLHVSLGRYYKRFAEMKLRKNVSRTRFIDHMREMLLRHMDESDAFKPVPPAPVSGSKAKF
ncbi:MAG: RteC domain-containing protein [Bacteroidetes bacterium]|nr:RteC domain-containing protein [Bacteroidota bacterium]